MSDGNIGSGREDQIHVAIEPGPRPSTGASAAAGTGPATGAPAAAGTGAAAGPGTGAPAGPAAEPGSIDPADLLGAGRATWKQRRDEWDHAVFNPEFHLGEDRRNADGTFRIRRAPEGGAGTGPRTIARGPQEARPLPVSTVEMFLVAAHYGLAKIAREPLLQIDKTEANDLAKPIVKLSELYGMKVDPRTEAWGMLIMACVAVYGPKFVALQAKASESRARRRAGQPSPGPRPAPSAPTPIHGDQPVADFPEIDLEQFGEIHAGPMMSGGV